MTSSSPSPPPQVEATPPSRGTIRFEDLGEPVQRLLRSLKGDVSDEDMALLEYVSVKDMAKIYSEMATDRHAEEIWKELRSALQARKEKIARREAELVEKQRALEMEQEAEAQRLRQQLEEEERERTAAELARHQRREDRRRRRAEKAAAAEEEAAAAAEEAAEEAAAAAEEAERQRKAEKKRKRREARARELQEEQDALAAERARHEAKKQQNSANQQKVWTDYVQNHPLEYGQSGSEDGARQRLPSFIEQKELKHTLNSPPVVSEKLLSRTYTPACGICGSRFDRPPREWNCPVCNRRNGSTVKVWQPDNDKGNCMMCKEPIGRWSRHHCRNCGRLVCANCSDKRAIIEVLGYETPVRVCYDCFRLRS
ncbi:hypothetical protein JKF63_01426 [Porcisia hertigi]|uniref:FYVE-type domain-containing protein n=1 Tax=Porcisia hertigi TaxID=2761500 RepID=A0A836KZF1_9TRYP|nr:hypothetical protein JKF63_01426 [Porcisia hertigi]